MLFAGDVGSRLTATDLALNSTARGGVVDEKAMIQALKDKQVRSTSVAFGRYSVGLTSVADCGCRAGRV